MVPVNQPPRHRDVAERMQRGPSGSNTSPCKCPGKQCLSIHELTDPLGVKSPQKNWSKEIKIGILTKVVTIDLMLLLSKMQVPAIAQENPINPKTEA